MGKANRDSLRFSSMQSNSGSTGFLAVAKGELLSLLPSFLPRLAQFLLLHSGEKMIESGKTGFVKLLL